MRDEYPNRIPLEQRVYVEAAYLTGSDGLGWHELARLFVLYGQFVDVRV